MNDGSRSDEREDRAGSEALKRYAESRVLVGAVEWSLDGRGASTVNNPFESTGFVVRRASNGEYVFAGTCFAFPTRNWFLTAHHVVRDIELADLGIALFLYQDVKKEEGLPVRHVASHPTADVALMRVDLDLRGPLKVFDPFVALSPRTDLGDPVRTFGFPVQSTASDVRMVPRMLRGYVQRHFRHESPRGYRYLALELSHAAPAGLSGSPVSLDGDSSNVIGVLAEDFQSATLLHSISEVEDDGTRFVDRAHTVVNYGVAVDLRPLEDWIRETVDGYDSA